MGWGVGSITGTARRGVATALAALLLSAAATAAEAYDRTGEASWYGKRYQGRSTASGEPFDMNGLTAAHRKLAFGSVVRVTNLDNRRSVVVRINDRGPYARGRLIDLSHRAASMLGFARAGTARVRVQLVREAPQAQTSRRPTPSLESIRESLRIVRRGPSQPADLQPPGNAGALRSPGNPASLRPPGNRDRQPMREVSPGVWVAPVSDAL